MRNQGIGKRKRGRGDYYFVSLLLGRFWGKERMSDERVGVGFLSLSLIILYSIHFYYIIYYILHITHYVYFILYIISIHLRMLGLSISCKGLYPWPNAPFCHFSFTLRVDLRLFCFNLF